MSITGTPVTAPTISAYASRSDIESCFGVKNVKTWGDLDNDGNLTNIAARIDDALLWATNEVNSFFRLSRYTVPFVAPIPLEISSITATLAGVYLYESRGIQDFNPDTGQAVHKLKYNKDRAYLTIRQILAGQRILDAEALDEYPMSGAED